MKVKGGSYAVDRKLSGRAGGDAAKGYRLYERELDQLFHPCLCLFFLSVTGEKERVGILDQPRFASVIATGA